MYTFALILLCFMFFLIYFHFILLMYVTFVFYIPDDDHVVGRNM